MDEQLESIDWSHRHRTVSYNSVHSRPTHLRDSRRDSDVDSIYSQPDELADSELQAEKEFGSLPRTRTPSLSHSETTISSNEESAATTPTSSCRTSFSGSRPNQKDNVSITPYRVIIDEEFASSYLSTDNVFSMIDWFFGDTVDPTKRPLASVYDAYEPSFPPHPAVRLSLKVKVSHADTDQSLRRASLPPFQCSQPDLKRPTRKRYSVY